MSITSAARLPRAPSLMTDELRLEIAEAVDRVGYLSGAQKTAAVAEVQALLTQGIALLNGAADLTKTAVVVDGSTVVLNKSDNTVSAIATVKSPATVTVVAGAVTKVTGGA
ncbi:putative Type II and type III secretion system protein [Ralstonia phage RSJ5]|uniref:Putative Type II and type III secretion system protein n=1 Tax=Ralstonia phage RSJ5 TaxID=1538364 RepID=A0A077KVQ9_9CAUD|nr:putative Type II and type III secretion system protein [Ralstonia phage RSJ5]BAP34933.1 putative Type II and type III secretion system protein [Ralstonia phage RSJ5]